MPVRSFDTKADFDSAYSIGAEPDGRPGSRPEVRLNYHRAVMMPYCQNRAAKLVELFGWPTTTRILFVGAGYAWTAEVMEQQFGYTNITTTDTSPWVQSNQDTSEEAEIDAAIAAAGLDPNTGPGASVKAKIHTPGNRRRHSRAVQNEDLSNNGSRNRIRSILGNIDVAITEDVLPSLSDSEITSIADRVDRINAGIARYHLVTTGGRVNQDPAFNWHTLAEYKALLPSDTFISLGDWQVL